LIIEDNGDMRKYIKTILKKDYNIIQAADGDEGINKAYKYIPDIIVSDIMMPGKDGYELCKMVRSNISTKDIPVILLTACVSNKHKVKGYESDADAYLVKPFSADVLKTRISKLIERRKNIIKTVNDSFFVNNIDMKKLADSQMDLIKKIIRYAEFHITEQINIDDLASYIGMSKSKLYRKLKDITQYSPIDIINLLKLKKGLNLILSEQITIAEAAYKSGFSSPCYFTKTFIKYYNESPREYLKRYSAAN